MTRVAPALTTSASAASITYRTGNFVRGIWTGFNIPFEVSMVGTDNTITLDTGILRRSQPFEDPGVICFSFSSGTVTVKTPAGRTIVMHRLREGMIVRKLGSFEISAGLVPNPMVGSGSTVFNFFNPFGENANIKFGSALVRVVPNPEPGTPGMLAALAGLAKRKLPT